MERQPKADAGRSLLRRISDPLMGPEATPVELALGWTAAAVAAAGQIAWVLVYGGGWTATQVVVAVLFAFDVGGGVVVNASAAARRWWHRPGQGPRQHLVFFAAHVHPFVIALLWVDYGWMQASVLYISMLLMAILVVTVPRRIKRPLAFGLGAVGIIAALTWLRMPPGIAWLPGLYYVKLVMAHAVDDSTP